MRHLYKSVVFLGALALALGTGARAQIVNGGFENGTGAPSPSGGTETLGNGNTQITGWTVVTTTQVSWDGNGAFSVPAASNGGNYYLDITGNNDTTNGTYMIGAQKYYTSGGVDQTFATTVGDTYDVSYLLGTDSYYNANSTPGIEAFISNTAPTSYGSLDLSDPTSESGLASGHPASRGVWTDESFDFTATSTSTTLTLIGYSAVDIGSNQYIGLDNVSVDNLGNLNQQGNGVPDAASTLALLAVGAVGLMAVRRRQVA